MIGELVGAYRVTAELGSGGMGRVYSATVEGRVAGLETGTSVAIKVVHPHLFDLPGFRDRFLREVRIGRTVTHPNVVRTYDGTAVPLSGEQLHIVVMEHVAGQTLRELLRELGSVPEDLCRHVGREVARGLAAIHASGALHRDLKPENVLITPHDEIKVMDLGMARLQDDAHRLSEAGVFVGSILYAAPEQFGGDFVPDHRADLHALGLLLYELATGRHPYAADEMPTVVGRLLHDEPARLSEIAPQLSPFFEEFVHTLLAKDRGLRFDSAADALGALESGELSRWWRERAQAMRRESTRPLRRMRVPRETAAYGRSNELARLRTLYRAVRAGEGRVLLLEGEAGIGKTRLLDEFTRGLRAEGERFHFLLGSYPAGGAATAAGAFSTAYREQFGTHGLERALLPHLGEATALLPAFAAVLRGEPAPDAEARVSRHAVFGAFVQATLSLSGERPTIVLIEDLQHAPKEGLALFATLARALAAHRILLVGTGRRGMPESWAAEIVVLDHAEKIALPRLGDEDVRALLADALASDELVSELGPQVLRAADGNPFFVFEILRGLRDRGLIAKEPDASWSATRDILQIAIPPSIADLVAARVMQLTERQRAVVDVAACCGFEFDSEVVGEVVELPRIPLLRMLSCIERRHFLVRSVGMRHEFDHHLVQEALYARLSDPLKRAYHAAIGAALETRRLAGDGIGSVAVDLCEHFLRGGRGERALPYLDAALGHLEHGYQSAQAVSLAEAALAVSDLVRGAERVELERRLERNLERVDAAGHGPS